MDAEIHPPWSVTAITLARAWLALCGGTVLHGRGGALGQEYAWVEKN